jgi:hypothetical protein
LGDQTEQVCHFAGHEGIWIAAHGSGVSTAVSRLERRDSACHGPRLIGLEPPTLAF